MFFFAFVSNENNLFQGKTLFRRGGVARAGFGRDVGDARSGKLCGERDHHRKVASHLLCRERGKEKLLEYLTETYFEADIEPRFMFQYRKDYMLGDIIILKNEYGITAYPRIIEVIESEDETGYKVVPTFESEEGKF